jgi:hypothetical protein
MLSFVMLNVVMPNVVMLSVVVPVSFISWTPSWKDNIGSFETNSTKTFDYLLLLLKLKRWVSSKFLSILFQMCRHCLSDLVTML